MISPEWFYPLGFLTPFVALAAVGLGMEVTERIKEWWRGRRIAVAAYARCREWGCDYDCASWLSRGKRRSVRQMMREHIEAKHTQPIDRCVKCGGPDGFHDPACVVHPMDHQPSGPSPTEAPGATGCESLPRTDRTGVNHDRSHPDDFRQ